MTGIRLGQLLRTFPERFGRVSSTPIDRSVDGLRFFAILIVVVGHFVARIFHNPHPNTEIWSEYRDFVYRYLLNQSSGVLLFFAISGYVTHKQLKHKFGDGVLPEHFIRYLASRFRRIAPPYYLIVIATFILVSSWDSVAANAIYFMNDPTSEDTALVASLLYSYGWIFDRWPKLFVPGWSLEIETQFYLIAPLLVFALQRYLKTTWGKIATAALLVFSLYAIGAFLADAPHIRMTLLRYIPYFLLGMAIYPYIDRMTAFLGRRILNILSIAALAAFFLLTEPKSIHEWGSLESYGFLFFNALSILFLFLGAHKEGTLVRALCSNRYVSFFGSICYSLYLTHTQVIYLLVFLFQKTTRISNPFLQTAAWFLPVSAAVLAAGFVFYVVVERPFMRSQKRPVVKAAQ